MAAEQSRFAANQKHRKDIDMARLDGSQSLTTGRGGYAFTGARIDRLEATDYTLATLAVDVTGSVSGFEQELDRVIHAVIGACKKNPRSDNIMFRLVFFSTMFPKGVSEIFGFTPLADIDVAAIPAIRPGGMTPLNDAAYEALGATNAYAKQLRDNDYGVNGIEFIVSDGGDNDSVMGMADVKREQQLAVSTEQLESNVSILIGVNTQQCGQALQRFATDAGMTQYVDAGDATAGRLAKLAAFVSRSISSQSQALGTGGPSQSIAPTI